jgi:hypothetical protein
MIYIGKVLHSYFVEPHFKSILIVEIESALGLTVVLKHRQQGVAPELSARLNPVKLSDGHGVSYQRAHSV